MAAFSLLVLVALAAAAGAAVLMYGRREKPREVRVHARERRRS